MAKNYIDSADTEFLHSVPRNTRSTVLDAVRHAEFCYVLCVYVVFQSHYSRDTSHPIERLNFMALGRTSGQDMATDFRR
jgi:hypothetical protein